VEPAAKRVPDFNIDLKDEGSDATSAKTAGEGEDWER
jgi:hypothetical protein